MKDPLFGNKFAAAVLTALLLFFGLPQLATALIGGGHHGKPGDELHLAYPIEYETAGGGGEVKVVEDLGTLMANASAKSGERRAAICASCHSFDKGGAQGTGPNLWDIINRDVAGVDGFGFTGALKGLGGAWTYERLDKYLENSQGYVPGTAMVQRFPKAKQRADILAYLATLSDNPAAFPAPAAPAAEEEHAEGEH